MYHAEAWIFSMQGRQLHHSFFCVPVQEDAMAKLDMFKGDGGVPGGRGAGGQGEAVASLMKKYQDLKEEYRLYRKKAMHAIQVMDLQYYIVHDWMILYETRQAYHGNLMYGITRYSVANVDAHANARSVQR